MNYGIKGLFISGVRGRVRELRVRVVCEEQFQQIYQESSWQLLQVS